MDSWSAPVVPTLPASMEVPTLALYDSARRGMFPTGNDRSQHRTMYVCGITPYDATHLGHAGTMITFDLVNRVWRDGGHDVSYVQNITDVDDPLLERAKRDGKDWLVLAMTETALFREDMEALRILPPVQYRGAVESIPSIVAGVTELIDRSAAYSLDDGTGDVYFDVAAAPDFGYESHLDRDAMLVLFAERGGDPDRVGKRDPLDPLLWRGRRAGEPVWDGEDLGPGRPGWHIECAVIALERLGATVDVLGGGNDLIYPHHECSSAHAEVLTGVRPFAHQYVHAGMIGLHGTKMSKSLGNLVFVSRLRGGGVDPMAIRLALIARHYRMDREWTDDLLEAGQKRLATWREAVAAPAGPSGTAVLSAVRTAMSTDLDTTAALSAVDRWSDAALAGIGDDTEAPALVATTVDALLGVRL